MRLSDNKIFDLISLLPQIDCGPLGLTRPPALRPPHLRRDRAPTTRRKSRRIEEMIFSTESTLRGHRGDRCSPSLCEKRAFPIDEVLTALLAFDSYSRGAKAQIRNKCGSKLATVIGTATWMKSQTKKNEVWHEGPDVRADRWIATAARGMR